MPEPEKHAMDKHGQNQAFLYVALAILLWASTAAVVKLLLVRLDWLQVLFFDSLFAAGTLLVLLGIQGKTNGLTRYSWKDHAHFASMGFLGVFIYHAFLFGGLQFSSAQEAFILNYTWPLWVVFLAVPLLKENLNLRKVAGMLLGFAGVFFVATQGQMTGFAAEHIFGNGLALAGAFCYGLFSVLGKKNRIDPIKAIFFYFAYSTAFSLAAVLMFSTIPHLRADEIIGLAWLGIFTSGIAFPLWFMALRQGDTGVISNLVFLTPFASLIYIVILLKEQILLSSLIGLALIVLGILMQTRKKSKMRSSA